MACSGDFSRDTRFLVASVSCTAGIKGLLAGRTESSTLLEHSSVLSVRPLTANFGVVGDSKSGATVPTDLPCVVSASGNIVTKVSASIPLDKLVDSLSCVSADLP